MMLSSLVLTPLVGAAVVAILPPGKSKQFDAVRITALLFSLVALVLALWSLTQFDTGTTGFQLTETYVWIAPIGAHIAWGVNGISLTLVLLTAILTPIVLLASMFDDIGENRNINGYLAWMLLLEGLAFGVFAANDVFLFYILFEATLIPIYFLIGRYGAGERSKAALKFLLYNLAGGLLMLAAVVGVYAISAASENGASMLFTDVAQLGIDGNTGRWLFLGFFAAFAIKAPMWPLHTWLPDAAGSATGGTSVLMVSVVDKFGTYGMIVLGLAFFPEAAVWAAPVVVVLAVIGVLYGAILAIGQDDIRRLIAFTSVSHFGFIVMGIFAFTKTAGSGASFYMFNHGLSTAALFLIAGALIARRGSGKISDFGGIQKSAPLLSGAFLIAGLSSLSLPGLSPFVSEFLVLVGTFQVNKWAAGFALLGMVLAALYILNMYQKIATGPTVPETERFADLAPREVLALAPAIVIIIVLGFFPRPVLDLINPSVDSLLDTVGVVQPEPEVDLPSEKGGN